MDNDSYEAADAEWPLNADAPSTLSLDLLERLKVENLDAADVGLLLADAKRKTRQVDALRAALKVLAEQLDLEGFVGHEECLVPEKSNTCDVCLALDLAHGIKHRCSVCAEAIDAPGACDECRSLEDCRGCGGGGIGRGGAGTCSTCGGVGVATRGE